MNNLSNKTNHFYLKLLSLSLTLLLLSNPTSAHKENQQKTRSNFRSKQNPNSQSTDSKQNKNRRVQFVEDSDQLNSKTESENSVNNLMFLKKKTLLNDKELRPNHDQYNSLFNTPIGYSNKKNQGEDLQNIIKADKFQKKTGSDRADRKQNQDVMVIETTNRLMRPPQSRIQNISSKV